MAVVPDSNRIPFYIYSANNFSNRIFYIGLFDFPRRRRPQKVQSLSAPRQEPHLYYSIRERKLQGRMHFLPYEISKPFRTQKSLYYRQKRLSAVLKTEPFRADLPVNGPAAPAARRFLPARASEKTGGCSTALGFAQRLRKNGSARRRSLATEGRIHKASFSGRVSLFPCERT
jgi:hypothetical protein